VISQYPAPKLRKSPVCTLMVGPNCTLIDKQLSGALRREAPINQKAEWVGMATWVICSAQGCSSL